MTNKVFFFLLFLFSTSILMAQTPVNFKKLKGKVMADNPDLEGIYIVNLKSEKSTLTERGGYFTINATVGDTLLFSAVQFKGIKLALREADFQKELLFVRLESLVRILDEVKINEYKNINAISLGIISANTKQYTPAERKLRTAEELHWYSPLLIPLGGMSVDGMINSISGRTAMLKKEVEVEKKEFLLQKIDNLFDEKYFIETLKIPEDYIKGFHYYIVEDANFVDSINKKNKTMATFIMNELAVKYKALLEEKK